jgi:hypothetical protein
MALLLLLLAVTLSGCHWLVEPLLGVGLWLLQLIALPWLLLALVAWLLLGGSAGLGRE